MAQVYPFKPYRYSDKAGPLDNLATQPYDKITPQMRQEYLKASPYNIVRIILGERQESDSDANNVYTRAANHLNDWIEKGILIQEDQPAFFAYFQEFVTPGTRAPMRRRGFIGLSQVTSYSDGVIHRHERTLSGPKKDRLDLLEHTHAHFGQIFVLYPDPPQEIDALLEEAASQEPIATLTDSYGVRHLLWRIEEPSRTARMQELMRDKKLVIADGHHRYETALAFSQAHPDLPGADRVMMTFVNMHSPGLQILATHRVVKRLDSFDLQQFLERLQPQFQMIPFHDLEQLKRALEVPAPSHIRIGVAAQGGKSLCLIERTRRPEELDVTVLHEEILASALGVDEEQVREGALHYIRGIDAAVELVQQDSPVAFLLRPTSAEDMARISFQGGVMPQKSTDFYPKLLSGLTIYRIGE